LKVFVQQGQVIGIHVRGGEGRTQIKAYNAIQFYLIDEVLQEVVNVNTAVGLWLKLESLYMTKSLTNRIYLKQRLFTLHMREGTPIKEHLEELNKILMDLINIDVIIDEEDQVFILLFSLHPFLESFVNSML